VEDWRNPGIWDRRDEVDANRWIFYDLADCELHVFVEADANKIVQRFYI
jgi:hypothetical protein